MLQRIQITDNRLVRRIETLARRERRAPQEVIAAAVAAYESQAESQNASAFLLAIAGLGTSGQSGVAEHDNGTNCSNELPKLPPLVLDNSH